MSREWDRSSVMNDFIKIAAESGLITTNLKPEDKDFVGNPSKETPVKDHRRYEPTEEYDITKGEDLVQQAHPEKIQVADAMGEGGVVENVNEQQEKDIDIATKMPTGAFIGVHAELINGLIKVATQLDDEGKHKEAKHIDRAIERLTHLPFSKSHLHKEAGWPLILFTIISAFAPAVVDWFRTKPGRYKGAPRVRRMKERGLVGRRGRAASLVATGVGILGLLGNKITSLQEGIKKDTQDLLSVLGKADSTSAKKAYNIFKPLAQSLLQANLSSEKGIKEFASVVMKMNATLPELKKYISVYTQLEDPSVTGFGLSGRVEAKFDDFEESLQEAAKTVADITSVGAKANINALKDMKQTAPQVAPTVKPQVTGDYNIQFLQQILFNRGFPKGDIWKGKVTGVMDINTIVAAKELEQKLDNALKSFIESKNLTGSFEGQIVKERQVVMGAHQLLKIIMLTEKYISEKG